MKIYTKTGDKGTTSLLSGKRVHKHHLRIDTYGEVDSLNSLVGLSISQAKKELIDACDMIILPLTKVQHELFNIGSLLACDSEDTKLNLPKITTQNITYLEELIDHWSGQLLPLKEFILPGGCLTASTINVTRASCRKCERLVSELRESEAVDEIILTYLNRLSDYLFTIGRYANHLAHTKEVVWKKEDK